MSTNFLTLLSIENMFLNNKQERKEGKKEGRRKKERKRIIVLLFQSVRDH